MNKNFIIAFVLVLALATTVFAEDDNATMAKALNIRYDQLACKVSFTNGQIDLVTKYAPNAASNYSISADKDKLTTDINTLKGFSDSYNRTEFDNYVATPFRPDLQKATQDLMSIKRSFKKYNVSNDTRAAFVTDLKSLNTQYSDCINDKELKMGQVMETHLENWDKYWTSIIDKMSKNGLNTTEMENLKAEIEAKNVQLQALLDAQNASQLKKYIGDYRQDQLHYAARFEVERLKGYRDKIGSEADKYNLTGMITDIDNKIATADKYSQQGYKYQQGDFQNVWNNIKGANMDMKNLSKDILQDRKQELKDLRQNGRGNMSNKTANRPNMPRGRGQ